MPPPRRRAVRRSADRRPITLVALLLAPFVAALLPLSVHPRAADATVRTPFNSVFSAEDNGAISIVGNSSMSCPTSAAGCATARARSGSNTVNNNWDMVLVDADTSSETTNSSSADLAMPAGSTVLYARLLWGGRVFAGDNGQAAAGSLNKVRLRTPGASGYTQVSAGTVIEPANMGDLQPYQASLDVTTQVAAAGNGTYWVGDIAAATGRDRYAGWSLVVAYRNPSLPLRNLVVFEGFADVTDGRNSSVNVSVSGFLAPASGPVNATVGFLSWEGDTEFTGDSMKFNNANLSDASRPPDNTFNSSITDLGTPRTDRVPAYPETFGVDLGRNNANGVLANSATSTTVNVSTSGDIIYLGLLTTEIDLFSPSFVGTSKTVTDLSGPEPAAIGDVLEYTLSFTNTGGDLADNVVLRDTLAAGISYVPGSLRVTAGANSGSTPKTDGVGDDVAEYVAAGRLVRFRLGTGATATAGGSLAVNATTTVKFRATVNRSAAGTSVPNGANLDYRARTLARNYTFVTNTVTTAVGTVADLSVVKTSTPASQNAGSAVTYTLTATNNGPNDATGVVVTDTLPAGLTYTSSNPPSGTTCSRSGQVVSCAVGALANGASVAIPVVATVASTVGAGSLLDVATVSADNADDNPANNTATATTTITRNADLRVTGAGPSGAVAGGQVSYTFTVTNLGPSTATAASLADSLPVALTFVSATASSGTCTLVTPTVTCALGEIAAGGTRTVTIVARLAPGYSTASLSTSATVSSATADPVSANNTATVVTPVTRDADVVLTKTASPTRPAAGTSVSYTLTVTNSGLSDANAVTLSDAVPAGMTFLSATPSQGTCNLSASPASCALGVLSPGATATVTVVGAIDSARTPGGLTNTASVSTSTPQTVTANDTASVVSTVVTGADLALTKTAEPDPAPVGEPLVYTLTATNAGPSLARSVVITDTLPAEVTLIDDAGCTASGRTITCPRGDLAVGDTATATIGVFLTAELPEGAGLSNSAVVTSATTDRNPADNTATFVSSTAASADLAVTKSASPDPVVPGQPVTYTVAVANLGPAVAQGVTLADTLPSGMTFVSATPEGACTAEGSAVSCALGNLGETPGTVTITAAVDPGLTDRTTTNRATASAASPNDPTTSNNTGSVTTTVAPSADLAVSLDSSAGQVRAGTAVDYTIRVSNAGPSDAAGVIATAQLPAGLVPVPGSLKPGCTVSDRTVRCKLSDPLAPGASLTFSVQATVDPSTPAGLVEATAFVGAATADPNPDDNSAALSVGVVTEADLVATKSADPTTLVAGDTVTYTVRSTSRGPADAVNPVITDTLPEGLTVLEAAPSLGTCVVTGQTVRCATDRLAPEGVFTVLITARVGADLTGTVSNSATVGSDTTEPEGQAGDNVVTLTSTLTRTADLRLTKTATPEPVLAGREITYDLTAYNAGPSDAADVAVGDGLPAGLTYTGGTAAGADCTVSATFGSCTFGTLPAGESRTIRFTALVAAGLADGTELTNTASLGSSTPVRNPDSLIASVTSTVRSRADLSITKTSSTESPIAGSTQEYVLSVVNAGPSTARNVVVTDPLPDGESYVSSVVAGGVCTSAAGVVSCPVGSLAPGGVAVVQLTAAVDPTLAGSTLANHAAVTSSTRDEATGDNTALLEQTVGAQNDLKLTKTVTSGPVVAGQPVSYAVTVQNLGPSRAQDVQIADPVGPGFGYASAIASADGSCGYDPRTATPQDDDQVSCTWPQLEVGQSRTATITLTTAATLAEGSTLTNTATATSAATDPTPATATVTSTVGARADLSGTKTLLSGLPVAGAQVRWQVLVRNAGPSLAQDVTVTDPAPAGVRFTGALTPQGSCEVTAGQVSCALGTVGPEPVTVTVVADLAADYDSPTLANRATISSSTTDPNGADNVATVSTSAAATANLAVVTTAAPEPVGVGQDVTWTMVVSNRGPSLARDLTVTDVLPAGVTLRSVGLPGGSCTPGSTVVCRVASLAVGSSVTLTVIGRLASGFAGGTLANTASVSAATADPDPLDNSSTATSTLRRRADLALTKTGPASVDAGSEVTWTLTARNAGPADATAATVVDTVPAWLTGVTGSSAAGSCALSGTELSCPVGTLAAAGTAVVTVTGRVPADRATGSLTNSATLSSAVTDPNPAQNTAEVTSEITRSAEVSLAKAATTNVFTPGSRVAWTVTASNAGPSTAEGVTVTDTLPVGVSEVTASLNGVDCPVTGRTVQCEVGVLTPGLPAIISVAGVLDAGAAAGSLANTAELRTVTPDPTPEDQTATSTTRVGPSADLAVGKHITTGTPVAGAEIGFDIAVSNTGPSTARNVVLSDAMPDTVAVSAVSTPRGSCTVAGQDISCALGDLANGDGVLVHVTGTVAQAFASTLANAATVSSDTDDPDSSDNTTLTTGAVDESADVAVTKSGPATASAGEVVAWRIQVTNAGPSRAREVSLTDLLPAGVTFLSATADDSGTTCSALVVCDLGRLDPDQTVTVTVRGRLRNDYAEPTVVNNAVVSAASADRDTINNGAQTQTTVRASADLSTTLDVSPSALTPGEDADYTVTVHNAGPSTATGATAVFELPAGMTLRGTPTLDGTDCTVTGRTVSCFLAVLEPGTSARVAVPVHLSPSYVGTSLAASASVAAVTDDPDPANNADAVTAPVEGRADLTLVKTGPATVVAGEAIGWRLSVRNDGPSDAQSAVVTDTLPAGVGAVVVSASQGSCDQAGARLTCTLGVLGVGSAVTIDLQTVGTLDATAAAGPLVNTATVTSPTGEADADLPSDPSAGRTSTVTTQVSTRADVQVYKVPTSLEAVAGGSIGWTVTVLNHGPSVAHDVVLSDPPAAGLTGVSITPPAGLTCDQAGRCPVGDLAPGAENARAFAVTGELPAGFTGATIANTAGAESATTDPDAGDNEARSVLPVTRAGNLTLVKTLLTNPVVAGQRVRWLLKVTNSGPSAATGGLLTDLLPDGLHDLQIDAPDQVVCSTAIRCGLPRLGVGASVQVGLSWLVDPDSAGTTMTNSASVSSDAVDPDPSDNASSVSAPVTGSADVRLTKTGPTAAVTPGDPIEWTLTLTNRGPSTARSLTVIDDVPGEVGSVTVSAPENGPATCDHVDHRVTCHLDRLDSGAAPVLVRVSGVLDPSYAGSSVVNTASVSADTPDPDPASNSATTSTDVAGFADLSLIKTVTPDPIVAGEPATFVIQVSNAGPSTARATSVIDNLAAGMTVVGNPTSTVGTCDVAGQHVGCNLGDLPATGNTPVRIEIAVVVAPDFDPTGFANSASVSSGGTADPDLTNNFDEVSGTTATRADLSLTKTADVASVVPGGTVIWTMTARNAGPSTARTVTLTDPLPAGVTLVSASASRGSCPLTAPVTCELGDLEPDGTATVTVTGRVAADATVAAVNSATLQSATRDPARGDNVAQARTPLVVTADLALRKRLDTTPVVAGAPVTWTVTTSNAGPSTARSVVVTDVLPAGVTWRTGSPGCTATGRRVECLVDAIVPGGSVDLTLTGDLAGSATGDLVNSASVVSAAADPNAENDRATSTAPITHVADLMATKVASTAEVEAGTEFSYTVSVANRGPSDAVGAELVEHWPDGLDLLGAKASQGTYSPTTHHWQLGPLANGASATLVLRVRATGAGSVANSVSLVGGDFTDPDPDNGVADVSLTVHKPPPPVPPPSPSPNPQPPGGTLPNTGGPPLWVGLLGLFLLLSGGSMLLGRRRRS